LKARIPGESGGVFETVIWVRQSLILGWLIIPQEGGDLRDTGVFLLGAVVGLAISGGIYGVFSFVTAPYADAIVSGVTLMGFGLALGGYFLRWRGDRSRELYFLLGVGIGIVVVAFLSAGAGVSPFIPS
jgi:hypothetical protein